MLNVLMVVLGFYTLNTLLAFIPSVFPGGNSVEMSYHGMTYVGIALLCGVIVICTRLILEKLSEIEKKILILEEKKDTDIKE